MALDIAAIANRKIRNSQRTKRNQEQDKTQKNTHRRNNDAESGKPRMKKKREREKGVAVEETTGKMYPMETIAFDKFNRTLEQ